MVISSKVRVNNMKKKLLLVIFVVVGAFLFVGCETEEPQECEQCQVCTECEVCEDTECQECAVCEVCEVCEDTPTISDEAFLEVLEELLSDHYSQPERDALIQGAINGMIDALDDPHTTYFDFEEYSHYQSGFGESYVGIGVTVTYVDNLIIVEEVKSGGPADQAGIRPNDIIAYVDGEDINFATDTEQYILNLTATDKFGLSVSQTKTISASLLNADFTCESSDGLSMEIGKQIRCDATISEPGNIEDYLWQFTGDPQTYQGVSCRTQTNS